MKYQARDCAPYCHCLLLASKYSPQNSNLRSFLSLFSLGGRPSFTAVKRCQQLIVLHIPFLNFSVHCPSWHIFTIYIYIYIYI
jgi:hypothetical protein